MANGIRLGYKVVGSVNMRVTDWAERIYLITRIVYFLASCLVTLTPESQNATNSSFLHNMLQSSISPIASLICTTTLSILHPRA